MQGLFSADYGGDTEKRNFALDKPQNTGYDF